MPWLQAKGDRAFFLPPIRKNERNERTMTTAAAKRVDIISLRMVKESSVLYPPRRVITPRDAVSLLSGFLDGWDREAFLVAYLNTKNEPTAIHTVSVGTLNSSLVHPREVYKGALLTNAASVILAHNHPSGDPTPSRTCMQNLHGVRPCDLRFD